MAKSRNTLSHVYDEDEALPIVKLIYSDYAPLLKKLDEDLGTLSNNADYQQFMNVGEEQADNENGVVYIYNEWYASMYGE